ncbi:hypothetical protein AMJ40_00290 [candidate division TA06 bacterium DG_26]|uniref:DUF6504 domain-containing protein n=1 Tax=candidate division TA06 bacterium DG_26 TaxID=1703771 RepID=A0A0S7WM95_UNCT6|nr:MAG: hypothetical protein AMJ40_00290 [candidate division TA06 bacterium DG_26]
MAGRFIGEKISVEPGECYPELRSFEWRGAQYEVLRVMEVRQAHGFARWLTRPRWWQREHKNFYQVQTKDGKVFEIYCDRGSRRRDWVLLREL